MGRTRYAELVAKAQPQIISNERSHGRALRFVDSLMKKRRRTKAEDKLLDLLAKLIDDYEETIFPTPEVSPARMLKHLIDAKGETQAEVARQACVPRSTLSEVLKGKRSISVVNAFRLAEYFHVDATLFLRR
jgi:HTH-type transcriptional regulator/antitoxin HigA